VALPKGTLVEQGRHPPGPCSRGLVSATWFPVRLAEGSRGGRGPSTSVLAQGHASGAGAPPTGPLLKGPGVSQMGSRAPCWRVTRRQRAGKRHALAQGVAPLHSVLVASLARRRSVYGYKFGKVARMEEPEVISYDHDDETMSCGRATERPLTV